MGQLVSPASSTRCVVLRFHFRFRGLNLGLAGPVYGPSGSVGPSVSAPCPPSRGGTRHVARLFTSIGREVAVALLKNHTHHTSIAPRRTRDCGHARPTPRTPDTRGVAWPLPWRIKRAIHLPPTALVAEAASGLWPLLKMPIQ